MAYDPAMEAMLLVEQGYGTGRSTHMDLDGPVTAGGHWLAASSGGTQV